MSLRARTAALVALIALATAGATGCGVRGSLDSPAKAKVQGTATSAEAGAAGTNSAATPKPHRPFILDDILR